MLAVATIFGERARAAHQQLAFARVEDLSGKHVAVQLRADRGTRQLPIVLVGVASSDGPKFDRAVPGPTRRYAGGLDQATVLEAIAKDL